MHRPSLRELAQELGISVATVSLALRDDARISAATKTRVKALATKRGYHADPVVAEGMSRARRKDFYRETVAWLLDRAPSGQEWLRTLFAAAEERGRMLGYQIEYFPVNFADAAELRRVTRIWKARGIRGVLTGPLLGPQTNPALPWAEFSWVTIGQSLLSPALHRVGRDYDKDIDTALNWLRAQGFRRTGFVMHSESRHLMRLPVLKASLLYYHQQAKKRPAAPANPLYENVDFDRPAEFARWLKANRYDSLVLSIQIPTTATAFRKLCADLPTVVLSPSENDVGFLPNYVSMGYSAMGLLHRLISEGETGVPVHEQTVVVSSGWRGTQVK